MIARSVRLGGWGFLFEVELAQYIKTCVNLSRLPFLLKRRSQIRRKPNFIHSIFQPKADVVIHSIACFSSFCLVIGDKRVFVVCFCKQTPHSANNPFFASVFFLLLRRNQKEKENRRVLKKFY